MVNPQEVDMNKVPKVFCDGAVGAFGENLFVFSIVSGSQLHSFATLPPIMKSLATWFSKQVELYEQQYGEIKTKPAQIISPLQMSDLKDGGEAPDKSKGKKKK